MPHLIQQPAGHAPVVEAFLSFVQNNEAVTPEAYTRSLFDSFNESAFWRNTPRFTEARRRLECTAALAYGWDTYGAEAPNALARDLARSVLDVLEGERLPPARLSPSSEGGITISFVEGDNRAEIEIYNTGEAAAATYSGDSEPVVWELSGFDSALMSAISTIRVHLTT